MTHETLKRLQDKLNDFEAQSEEAQAQVDHLKEQVNAAVENEEHAPALIEWLDRALILFDNDHPDIAAAIRKTINVLINSGV